MNGMNGYRESHLGKGTDYDVMFSNQPHTRMLWQLEQRVLDRILREYFMSSRPRYLDFACGTGRILAYLSERTSDPTGVDVSASMLAVAAARAPRVRLIEADLTRDHCLSGEQFDLITAFRFFGNAEPALRRDALRAIRSLLKADGVFVFNNHVNESSLMRRIGRRLGRFKAGGMGHVDVESMLRGEGLSVLRTYPIGILPLNDRAMIRPVGVALALESLVSRVFSGQSFAQDVLYVCGGSHAQQVEGAATD